MDEDKKPDDLQVPEPSEVQIVGEPSPEDIAAAFGHKNSTHEAEEVDEPATETEEPKTANEEPIPSETTSAATLTVKKKRFGKKRVVFGFAALALAAICLGGAWVAGGSKNSQQPASNNTNAQTIDDSTSEAKPVSSTVVWLETPKKLAIQPVFTEQWFKDTFQDGSKIEDVESFYQVGSIGDDQLFIALIDNGIGSQTMLYKKSGDTYTLYQQHSPNAFYASTEGGKETYQGPTLRPGVKVDVSSQFTDIVPPTDTTIKKQAFTVSKYGAIGVDFIATKEPASRDNLLYISVEDTAEGKLYESVSREDPSYRVSYFTLMTKDHRMHAYKINSDLFTAGIPAITWSASNKKNTTEYRSAVGGCGFSDANEIAKNFSEANLEVVGTAANGQKVYITKNLDDALFVKHYGEYLEVAANNENLAADEKNMTAAEFKKRVGFYAAKDSQGRWIVMSNEKYVPGGGCAKPVVYLYPAVATFVNVGVGADVTLSDPYYPSGGWKAVLAQASGKLVYQGKQYDSLFWEGYGHGTYPTVESGAFVKRSDVESVIRSDLVLQGLNQKEVQDFWDFWQTKVPTKDYVRITWLSKQQLQALAPLYIAPKPDTVIRVFLDMEGTDTPYTLLPQEFVTPKRTGFTVVEWGGLARDGSVPTLR